MSILETVLQEPQRLFQGVVNPVITPLLPDKSLDEKGLEKVITHSMSNEINTLFLLGHTGEFQYLPMEMKKRIIGIGIAMRRDGIKIIVGTSGENMEGTIELSKYAASKGVDGIVLAPKYKSEMGTVEYVSAVADATSDSNVPILIYNNPAICDGKNILISEMRALLEDSQYGQRIAGVKDSSENYGKENVPEDYVDVIKLIGLRDSIATWMSVFQGSERALMRFPELKVDGLVAGSSNFDPKLFSDIYKKLEKLWSGKIKVEDINKEFNRDFGQLFLYTEKYRNSESPIKEIKKYAKDRALIGSDNMFLKAA